MGSGESPAAPDAQLVDELVNAAIPTLEAEFGIVLPFDISAIPEAYQVPMRDFVASRAAPSFELARNPELEDAAILSLRRIRMGKNSFQSPRADYF